MIIHIGWTFDIQTFSKVRKVHVLPNRNTRKVNSLFPANCFLSKLLVKMQVKNDFLGGWAFNIWVLSHQNHNFVVVVLIWVNWNGKVTRGDGPLRSTIFGSLEGMSGLYVCASRGADDTSFWEKKIVCVGARERVCMKREHISGEGWHLYLKYAQ